MKLSSTNLPHSVLCPTSKSHAARALILASLKGEPVELLGVPKAQDTIDLINLLKTIGLDIIQTYKSLIIKNSFPACEKHSEAELQVFAGEGGTTVRFILPLLALGKNKYTVTLSAGMLARPMDELYQTLSELHVKVIKTDNGVSLQGPMGIDENVFIDCEKSSQFASGFELLKLKFNHKIQYKNLNHSLKYFDMTKKLIKHFEQNNSYSIPADFSSLGYFVALAIFKQNIHIANVKKIDTDQADSKIFDILDTIGAKYEFSDKGLVINKCEDFKAGVDLDGSACLDLVPTICFIASYIPHTSMIRKIKKLRYKESDRLDETMSILKKFNVDFSYNEESDSLQINGGTLGVSSTNYKTQPDHRMIMLVSLFFKNNSGGVVEPTIHVQKSFPDFFSYFL